MPIPVVIPEVPLYRKTLRLSSEQIGALSLHDGANKCEFSVVTPYQGTVTTDCNIFLWRHSDRIIVSDVDGTITKSDVLGHLLPMVGRDWSQSGVARLFSRVNANGYKFLYLSARAIGQATLTRTYLTSVRQEDALMLPEGPVILSPQSLINAFHQEVIERNPERFKISCLTDIASLFSAPLYAGFGNRSNDAFAYRTVGIPEARIFTVNHRGEVANSYAFRSTYGQLADLVEQVFPPVVSLDAAADFTAFRYWRLNETAAL